jgi:hypothetical protein
MSEHQSNSTGGRLRFTLSPGHLVTLSLFFFITGCGGNAVTKSNFDRLRTGMSLQQVEAILGKGTELKRDELAEFMKGQETPEEPSKDDPEAGKAKPPNLSDYRAYRWTNGKRSITVLFLADRLFLPYKDGL